MVRSHPSRRFIKDNRRGKMTFSKTPMGIKKQAMKPSLQSNIPVLLLCHSLKDRDPLGVLPAEKDADTRPIDEQFNNLSLEDGPLVPERASSSSSSEVVHSVTVKISPEDDPLEPEDDPLVDIVLDQELAIVNEKIARLELKESMQVCEENKQYFGCPEKVDELLYLLRDDETIFDIDSLFDTPSLQINVYR